MIMRGKSLHVSLILVISLIGVFADASDGGLGSTPTIVFRTNSGTVQSYVGESHNTFDFGGLSRFDTTVLRTMDPLILIADIDTLVIRYSNEPVNFMIIKSGDTVYETIHFIDPFLEKLKNYAEFGSTTPAGMGPFLYADSSEKELVRLREEFNLDSVAGKGGEVERIINLMGWAHRIVRHDGQTPMPDVSTITDLIKLCRNENRGVTCGGMANILNQAYLSMGFKSRQMGCFPEDRDDPDSHGTVMVFSRTLNKWVYMDPTFEAYFMDRDSTLLGFAEIRQHMIDNRPLLMPSGMNWNGQPYDQDTYINYMMKNFFHFQTSMFSGPGRTSKTTNFEVVHLNPGGFQSEKNGKADTTGTPGKLMIDYFTDNADLFWSKP